MEHLKNKKNTMHPKHLKYGGLVFQQKACLVCVRFSVGQKMSLVIVFSNPLPFLLFWCEKLNTAKASFFVRCNNPVAGYHLQNDKCLTKEVALWALSLLQGILMGKTSREGMC